MRLVVVNMIYICNMNWICTKQSLCPVLHSLSLKLALPCYYQPIIIWWHMMLITGRPYISAQTAWKWKCEWQQQIHELVTQSLWKWPTICASYIRYIVYLRLWNRALSNRSMCTQQASHWRRKVKKTYKQTQTWRHTDVQYIVGVCTGANT